MASTVGVLLREDIIGGSSVSVRLRNRHVNLRIFNKAIIPLTKKMYGPIL
jgi:hypothetical protein